MTGLAVAFLGSSIGLHRVPEGHVAVYYRGGALLQKTKGPGFQMMTPFVTKVHYVQTTVQTDKVTDIPCVSSRSRSVAHELCISRVRWCDGACVCRGAGYLGRHRHLL